MTDARLSQLPVEVLRTNLAPDVQVSQLAVEILRPNSAKGFSASAGSYTLTGQTSNSIYTRVVKSAAGAITLTGQAALFKRGLKVVAGTGALTFTGIDAQFLRPSVLSASPGIFTLSGVSATLLADKYLAGAAGAFTLTGQSASLTKRRRLVALPGGITLTGGTMVSFGIIAIPGTFTLTGTNAIVTYRHARVISDMLYISDPDVTKLTSSTSLADAYRIYDTLKPARGNVFSDGLGIGSALSYDAHLGKIVNEIFETTDTATATSLYQQSLSDSLRFLDALTVAFPRTLAESITIADVASVIRGWVVLEQLRLIDTSVGAADYYLSILDGLRMSDDLRRFFAGDVLETITITDSLTRAPILKRTATETVTIDAALAQKLIIRIVAADTFALADTTPLHWIFNPTLADQFEISVGQISPGGDFTTWAINTRTGAVTEYSNYNFNSFAQLGHKYLGTAPSGLYELNGDTDASEQIIAQIKSGYAQFGGSKYSSFKAAYIGMRGSGDIILKLDTGDGKTYTYQTVVQDMQSTKVRLGKGLRARYFAFELISTGPDFDLDTIEFIPLVAQRRV